MRDPIAVFVYAGDPLSQVGVLAMLEKCPDVKVVDAHDIDRATVALVVADEVTMEVIKVIRAVQRDGVPRVVAVISRIDEDAVVGAVAAGASVLLRRDHADVRRLGAAISQAAHAESPLPSELVTRVVAAARRRGVDGEGRSVPALARRDLAVLQLVAEGYDTAEVAERMAYSESTIKGVLRKVMFRLEARNRSHAVALALREGLI